MAEYEHLQAVAGVSPGNAACRTCIFDLTSMKEKLKMALPHNSPSDESTQRFFVRCGVNQAWPLKDAVVKDELC